MNPNTDNASLHRELHISRKARDRYQLGEALYASAGNVIFPNFRAVREFAQKMNATRDLVRFPEQAVQAGQLNALGLIDEMLHLACKRYRDEVDPNVFGKALARTAGSLGPDAVDRVLRRFTDEFPPLRVYRRELTVDEYLDGATDGTPNRQVALEELVMLWLANTNPACAPYQELFDDTALQRETPYRAVVAELERFLADNPTFGPERVSLIEVLRGPSRAAPHSLSAQLDYIRTKWGWFIGTYLFKLLGGLDLIREEEKPVFFGPGPALVPSYADLAGYDEPERFSPDRDWMPRAVLLAKNAHVWLDQLSRKYQREVARLDQIPDEELDLIASRGFTVLWLIGLWERSKASRAIKQMCGNPDAVASAYSLADYTIAADLGGDEALQELKVRAKQRGIRLASDMVPNHMGIDSRWVIEHPDWFVSLDYSPFPVYSFNGADHSSDERVGIFLEDHYYERSDAAVVFKRLDRWTGSVKYVYHGNDGTRMPWNDTAQLNFLNPEVREAVIQTILHVARQFPVIRFDAAMTLTKKHFQRLWFPEPGTGGDIPSRAEHAMTRRQFNEAMPEEFWREVVDRVAQEAPDTLLLAEAFWLMEGYFVRTLGMHRVYNSAFMNMLRDEENSKYRSVIKNTLEFDPDVLKRLVNFINNPDEKTAVEQFGKGDKYFGICLLLSTLPGLPMFGHGQVEGFSEKYGMEYSRAYWEETPDQPFVEHHERVIFPILKRRYIFADVEHFLMYDLWTSDGHVNEDVFAYSNRFGDERALILYNNRYADAHGWIRSSVGFAVKCPDGSKRIEQRTLADGLGLTRDETHFVLYRDQISGLEFVRPSMVVCDRGLEVHLGAYQYQALMDIREIVDNEWRHYAELCAYLNGRGVPSIEEALVEVLVQPIHQALRRLTQPALLRRLADAYTGARAGVDAAIVADIDERGRELLDRVRDHVGAECDVEAIADEVRARWEAALALRAPTQAAAQPADAATPLTLACWLAVHALGHVAGDELAVEMSRSWIDEWQLGRVMSGAMIDCGLDEGAASYAVTLVKALTAHQGWSRRDGASASTLVASLFSDMDVQRLLRVNRHQGVLWYNREAFDKLLWWLSTTEGVLAEAGVAGLAPAPERDAAIGALRAASSAAGFQVGKLTELVGEPAATV